MPVKPIVSATSKAARSAGAVIATAGAVLMHCAGRSNASVTASEPEPPPSAALTPMPRLAKPCQIRHSLAPPLLAASAARIASRASRKVGLQGWSFSPSTTSWMAMLLPPVPV